MKNKIIGIENVNYVNKNGKQIEGMKFYFTYPVRDVIGGKPADCYVSKYILERSVKIPELGDEVEFFYDHSGRVTRIEY